MKKKVQTPFISLTPIPTLLIDRVNVDFQMEVTSSETDKSNISSDVSTKISRGCFEKAEINGKVGTFHENTYLSNQTAKYQIHASASQHPQTKDSSIPMNIMDNCMDQKPKKYSSSKEDEEKNGERTE